jgi:hypothetical protein
MVPGLYIKTPTFRRVGGRLTRTFLSLSLPALCSDENLLKYCPPIYRPTTSFRHARRRIIPKSLSYGREKRRERRRVNGVSL